MYYPKLTFQELDLSTSESFAYSRVKFFTHLYLR